MHPQAADRLTLHRFNGDEVFSITSATGRVLADPDAFKLNLEIETSRPAVQSLPDTVDLAAEPNAEVTLYLPNENVGSLVGRSFSVPRSFDEAIEDRVSRFYYCEHEDLDENVIEFIEQRGDWFRVRWTGVTVDVNWYDGSKPATRVEIVAWFQISDRG